MSLTLTPEANPGNVGSRRGSAELHHCYHGSQRAAETRSRAKASDLDRDAEALWLDPKIQEPEKLLPLLRQYPPDEMEFYPVSREVNSPAVDKASNIEPVSQDGLA
jgi:hypothetical protein